MLNFIAWWFYTAPKKLFEVGKKLTYMVNNQLSFTLNIRLLFTPLYGDYTIIGRFIGFVLRIFFIAFGLFFIVTLVLITLILPIVWYILPIVVIYYLDYWSIFVLLAVFLYVIYLDLNKPQKTLSQVNADNELEAARPLIKNLLETFSQDSDYKILKFLKNTEIQLILRKSELDNKDFEERISKAKKISFNEIKENTFEYAKKNKSKYIESEHLFLGLLKSIKNVDNILAAYGSELKIIEETVYWIVNQREELSKLYFWQDDYEMPAITGFGHGLTGRVTPNLDSISTDFTKMAGTGRLRNIVGRETEIEKIANLLSGSKENILLIGDPGCGKTSIVMGIAHKIMHGSEYKTLQNKRLVSLQLGGLLSGTEGKGMLAKKLTFALEDAIGSGDIILFIDEIHSLVGSTEEREGLSTIYSILEPYLSSSQIQLIGATSIDNYRKYIEPMGSFSRLFEIVEIPEANYEDTLKILKYVAEKQEEEHKVEITMPALITISKLSKKLIHDRVNPDKSIDVLVRAVSEAKNSNKKVDTKLVEKEISEMTHIPVTEVNQEESVKLLNILSEMKKYVVGQDPALEQIAAALKRARVGIRDENKPIASFLFVGTTGVGKTETAKTLSRVYFGDEKSMIRLDMSEYQTIDSLDRLIGTPDGQNRGILIEEVRSKPYTVVLLDEIEKAHHKILLTFLQVLDDGRLTDSTGRTVDFNNTIIIATSNVGTKKIQEITNKEGSFEEIEKAALQSVREQFAPEFLNRFTGIIVYKPLSIDEVRKITRILLKKVSQRVEEKNIKVTFSEGLVDELVKRGFNPQWGARPLSRVIEDKVETYLADKILSKEIKSGDAIKIDEMIFD